MRCALDRTGGLRPRVPQPSAALTDARARVVRLLERWDDGEAAALAADNLFLDEPADRRRAQIEAIRAAQGTCRPDGPFDVENALRGVWKMTCDRGSLRVGVTLAPTSPPLVQEWTIVAVRPVARDLEQAVNAIVRSISSGSRGRLPVKLGAGVDRAAVRRLLQSAEAWGACKVDEVLSSDGERSARVRLACTKGGLDLLVALDPASRVLTRLQIVPSGNRACVP